MIKIYTKTIKEIKQAILQSRYKAAVLANRELLLLYLNIGKLITEKIEEAQWGDKILTQISADLQVELPGLKGFSTSNIKRMKTFYVTYYESFTISPTLSDQIGINVISPTASDQIENNKKRGRNKKINPISPTASDQLEVAFLSTSFSHHIEIITHSKTMEERFFYIQKVAYEFWPLTTLKYHLENKLFKKKGTLPNNFDRTISNKDLRAKALDSFKDEYLLDFINIEDPEEAEEKIIENEIVRNIKKFMMGLGTDFAFISNQYRLMVDEEEYFIDLLFFNRKLQCLVVFELKRGKFKPEYVGKMNFYLSALDDMVKQPHELPSIGIILCKEKNNKTVEFSFRDIKSSMGVATYKTSDKLPKKYKGALPDAETLKRLLD